jgi:hypothetical protein
MGQISVESAIIPECQTTLSLRLMICIKIVTYTCQELHHFAASITTPSFDRCIVLLPSKVIIQISLHSNEVLPITIHQNDL